ncbi:hypothetical protein A3843_00165 [Pseudovibrio exalbescens]|uniref:Bacterial CdiA-CT RNAse A domain-containing protein n=2 Tax=Pseudovibrio exalbescens TaxID=197461 RepID=A0A1U7JDJ9_9HYPH|nr:polymorphic toxin type 50 domain-containing protein [Pseudovibrio exalbescens]OKL42764.1 hypothetical protein A3843_00165 [Pseudovibrio exalbescens]
MEGGVTRATVGEGEILIRDEDKQQELEESGATTSLASLNRDVTIAQEITRDEEEYVGVYISDEAVRAAVESIEVVGRALADVSDELFETLGKDSANIGQLSAAKKAGQLSDEAIVRQLAQCGTSQQGFNLLDWIVSPALAGPASCTVRTNDGFTINLTQEEGRQCLEAYLGIAIADPAKASKLTKWLAQGTLSAPVRAIGQLGALYSGPQSLGTDDQGVPLYLVDEKGRHLYKNDITGQYFFANPSNPTDIAMVATAMDLSALAASGTAFTTTRLPKSLKNVVDTPNGPDTTRLTAADFPKVRTTVSQKQNRHIEGRAEYRGGGTLVSQADAQRVLDAYHSGDAIILGKTSQGFPVVRFNGVTGINNNVGAGIANQPTNVFIVKGTASPSIVPSNPNWTP